MTDNSLASSMWERNGKNSCTNFLGSEFGRVSPSESLFHVIPAPLESSVSYGRGTAAGPQAIINASQQLEQWDGFSVPGEKGIYTRFPDFSLLSASGSGKGAGKTPGTEREAEKSGQHKSYAERFLGILEAETAAVLKDRKIPVILGGEHTVSVAPFRAISADPRLSGKTAILQFDAHADLRDSYGGNSLSHACVMRRAFDLGIPFFQAGIRSISPEEVRFREEEKINYLDARKAFEEGITTIKLPEHFPEYLYITVDVDGLDPSVIPATGTPEPGGLGWYQLLSMVESAATQRKIIGFDVVELAPLPLQGFQASDFAAARLVYNIMGITARSLSLREKNGT